MKGITKRFSGVTANNNVNFSVEAGEVHALLGENGAGKSTLMNVLYGLYHPDEGEVIIGGKPCIFNSPSDAISAGIGMVHQHFMLVQTQTVWENMILGLDMPFILPKKQIIDKINELGEKYGLAVDPLVQVWQLSMGEQQRVAILQMLYRSAKVLILDEPTAVLTPQESTRLFKTITRMTADGHGVIFISHKMNEVMNETNRVTVLRKGERVGTVKTAETTQERLSEMMMGRKISLEIHKPKCELGRIVLEADNVSALNDRGLPAVRGISFRLREREIIGVAGVAGNGQLELCEALFGLRDIGGSVKIDGKNITNATSREFLNSSVHYIPADRRGTGMVPNLDVRSNSILTNYWKNPISNGNSIDWRLADVYTESIVHDFNVSTPSSGTPVRSLSGGNLQKLMLGRELSSKPKVLIAMHPTWGLDVAATHYVRERIVGAAVDGAGVLLISEDIDELIALSDRLAVIFKGEFMGIISHPKAIAIENIGLMMAGTPISEVLQNA